ncbi:MAG TPA: hypothetical protein VF311_08220 [Terriglobales bacterium]
MTLPTPVLRSFDLLAFCFQNGLLELKACEAMRSELLRIGEGLPAAFKHASFENGLKSFAPRLRDGTPTLAASSGSYSMPLFISKI